MSSHKQQTAQICGCDTEAAATNRQRWKIKLYFGTTYHNNTAEVSVYAACMSCHQIIFFYFCFVGACRRPAMTLSIPQCPVEDESQLSHSLHPPISCRKLWAVAVCVNLFDEAAARLWLYTELLKNFREMSRRCICSSVVLHVCCKVEEVMNAAQSKLERCPYRE